MIAQSSQLKNQAIELLGEDLFNKAMQMSIVDLHKVFSRASLKNQCSKDTKGYNLVIAYRHSNATKQTLKSKPAYQIRPGDRISLSLDQSDTVKSLFHYTGIGVVSLRLGSGKIIKYRFNDDVTMP